MPGILREPPEDPWSTCVGTSRLFLGSGLPGLEIDGLGVSRLTLSEPRNQPGTLAAQESGSEPCGTRSPMSD